MGVNREDMDLPMGTGTIAWSVPVEDPDELHAKYEELRKLVPTFRSLGYEVEPQEDPDFFGAILRPQVNDEDHAITNMMNDYVKNS